MASRRAPPLEQAIYRDNAAGVASAFALQPELVNVDAKTKAAYFMRAATQGASVSVFIELESKLGPPANIVELATVIAMSGKPAGVLLYLGEKMTREERTTVRETVSTFVETVNTDDGLEVYGMFGPCTTHLRRKEDVQIHLERVKATLDVLCAHDW